MKYSVEVETDSLVYDTPCSSPAAGRQLNWAIEVDYIYCRCVVCGCVGSRTLCTGPERWIVSTVDIVLQVDIRSVEGEVVAVRRVSRIQKEDELLQKAMRKKSRKVGGVIMKLRVDFRLKLYIYYRCRGRGTGWCSLRRWGC